MKSIFVRFVPILVFVLALTACGGTAGDSTQVSEAELSGGADFAGEAPALEEQRAALDMEQPATDAASTEQSQDIQRLIIKNADLSMEVSDVREAETAVRARVNELGGYIVRVETNGTDENLTARITFRVPAEQFEAALAGVQGLASEVRSRTVSGDDVTEEFVDLEARLRNLEATRDRLLDLLERATRVEDALQVNTALSQVQGEIEQIRGRMQYLQQSAALSTVTVFLMPVPVTPIVREGTWHPLAVARDALRNLIELGQGLVNLGIVLLIWTPVWLPLLLLARWLWRKARLRLARRRGTAVTGTAQPQG